MRQSLRSIRLFAAAYEELSFTRAAQRENATQSGVSQHIMDLEETLGVSLFIRGDGVVRPTPAGTAYYLACVDVLKAHERATRSIQPYNRGHVGEITIGLLPSMTRSVLAPSFARFAQANPNVVVRVIEAYSGDLIERVRAGEMTFAIVPAAPATNTKGARPSLFARTPELLVSGADSGRVHGAPVRLGDLGPLRLVLPGHENARRPIIEAYLWAHGASVECRLEFDTAFGTLDLVARGGWSAILPAVMMSPELEKAQDRFTIHPIVDPPFLLDLFLIEPARQVMSEAAEQFLECMRVEMAHIEQLNASFMGSAHRSPT
jgi:LysR family transcriptional regulator, nitrogen assimilation regulatory protein